jgi:hypothetical protein
LIHRVWNGVLRLVGVAEHAHRERQQLRPRFGEQPFERRAAVVWAAATRAPMSVLVRRLAGRPLRIRPGGLGRFCVAGTARLAGRRHRQTSDG